MTKCQREVANGGGLQHMSRQTFNSVMSAGGMIAEINAMRANEDIDLKARTQAELSR